MRCISKAIALLIPAIATLAGWAAFGPQQLGGPAAYLITAGNSMEPGIKAGDLVILREREDYEVGDAVAFHITGMGHVLHRIVAQRDNRFIMKGDNNSDIDPYQPTEEEIVGMLWIHLPGVGRLLEATRHPAIFTGLVTVLGSVLLTLRQPTRRLKRPGQRSGGRSHVRSALTPLLGTSGEIAWIAVLVLACASLALGAVAFSRPAKRHAEIAIPYSHEGHFAYSAGAAVDLYGGSAPPANQPVYRRLSDSITVLFDYRLVTGATTDLQGVARMDASISFVDGWTRQIPLGSESRFAGNTLSTQAVIDLDDIQQLIDDHRRQAGLPDTTSWRYVMTVTPAVTISGELASIPISESFAPDLRFSIDPTVVRIEPASGEQGQDPLSQSTAGTISLPVLEPGSIPVPGRDIGVERARRLAIVGVSVAVVSGIVLLALVWQAQLAAEPARIFARYGALLVAVRDSNAIPGASVIDVQRIEDLVSIAEREGRMILHHQRGPSDEYIVHDVGVTYRYCTVDTAPPVTTPGPEWSM